MRFGRNDAVRSEKARRGGLVLDESRDDPVRVTEGLCGEVL